MGTLRRTMSRRPFWLIECLDREEADALLEHSPLGSHIEVVPKEHGDLVILWVPISEEDQAELKELT